MNYRHGFHAGNFADVFKHALLARLILHLTRKETPFRVIDTHAGEGAYDLCADEAERTGEWRFGVGRLADLSAVDAATRELLGPYLDLVGPRDAEGRPQRYPGSPLIATRLLRAQDRAIFCELRGDAFAALQARFARDKRVKTIHLDGYLGLSAFVPPKERRGLVLVDPPFEQRDEAERMLQGFLDAYRKWPTGIYALWLPIKDDALSRSFVERLRARGVKKILRLDLSVGGAADDQKLRRTSLVVVNPPFTFAQDARSIGAFLAERLARGPGAGFEIEDASAE